MTPPIIETFYRVDGVVTRAWRYTKRVAFGALLGYGLWARAQLEAIAQRRATSAKTLTAVMAPIVVADTARARVEAQTDTIAREVVRYVQHFDTLPLLIRNTIMVNGVSSIAVPLPEAKVIDDGRKSCGKLTQAIENVETACDSAVHTRDRAIDSLKSIIGLLPIPSSKRATVTYALLFAGADYANRQFHFDVDRGGYVDSWRTMDKLTHAAFGATLAITAVDMGVKPKWAIALTCAGAAGFEWSQGHASRKDLIAGCGGAIAGVSVRWVARRLVGRR